MAKTLPQIRQALHVEIGKLQAVLLGLKAVEADIDEIIAPTPGVPFTAPSAYGSPYGATY